MHISEYTSWVYYPAEKEAYNMTYTKYIHIICVQSSRKSKKKKKRTKCVRLEFTAPFLYVRSPQGYDVVYEPALYHYCTASGGYNGQT